MEIRIDKFRRYCDNNLCKDCLIGFTMTITIWCFVVKYHPEYRMIIRAFLIILSAAPILRHIYNCSNLDRYKRGWYTTDSMEMIFMLKMTYKLYNKNKDRLYDEMHFLFKNTNADLHKIKFICEGYDADIVWGDNQNIIILAITIFIGLGSIVTTLLQETQDNLLSSLGIVLFFIVLYFVFYFLIGIKRTNDIARGKYISIILHEKLEDENNEVV